MTELARSQLRPLSPSVVSSGLQSAAPWTPKASASPRVGINGSTTALADLPNGGVRASLLVRMWKEVESEAAMKAQESCIHSPRVQCVDPNMNCPVKKVLTNSHDETPSPPQPPPAAEHEPPSVIEVHHDEYNSIADSLETIREQGCDTGQCGGRVADIVRKLSLVAQSENGATPAASASPTPTASAEHRKNEAAALLNEVSSPATTKLQDEYVQQRNESRGTPDEIKIERYAFNRNSPRVRGRMATMDVLVRMKHERQGELAALEENRAVSEFSHRSRIHAFLKFKCLRKGGTSRNQGTYALGTPKLKELWLETPLSERSVTSGFSSIPESPTNSVPAYENRFAQASDLAEPLSLAASSASFMTTITVEEGAGNVTQGGRGILLAKQSSFSDRGHPHEESEGNSDVLLEEDRSSVAENTEWDGCIGIATPEGWQGGASPDHQGVPASGLPHDEDEPLESGRWMDFLSAGSHRPWESCKRSLRYDWYDSTSDNPELEQLLKRKSVSTSLASGFRKKMDQLIMSHIEKQEQLAESEYPDTKEEGLNPLQQKNNVGTQADHAAATSRSETPSLVGALGELVDDNHHLVFADNYPQPSDSSELELISSLKGEITQLRHWMYKLQKSVENCMDMQVELQESMRQVLSAVLCNSGRVEKVSTCYKQVSNNRGICCICCSVQVDSILYRCGHMCTCFNCAQELQWSCRTCPICQAPIDDVVKTYPNPC